MEFTQELLQEIEQVKKLLFIPEIQKVAAQGVNVQGLAYQHAFVFGYNAAVQFTPELVITVEEFNTYVSEALGLASQGLAS